MHLTALTPTPGDASASAASNTVPASPFRITIGLSAVVAHRGWTEARTALLEHLSCGRSPVLVLGAAGTGKTLLLEDVAAALEANGVAVVTQKRGDLPFSDAPSGDQMRRRVMLIDEADRMDGPALQGLRQLRNSAFVLAGLDAPQEDDRAAYAEAPIVRLAPLRTEEVATFVSARLEQSGLRADLITKAAIVQLAERSGGIPRMLNTLISAALFLARAEGSLRVEPEHIAQATALREGGSTAAPPLQRAAPPPTPPTPPTPPVAAEATLAPAAPQTQAAPEAIAAPEAKAALAPPRQASRPRSMPALCAAVAIAAAWGWVLLVRDPPLRDGTALSIDAAPAPAPVRLVMAAPPTTQAPEDPTPAMPLVLTRAGTADAQASTAERPAAPGLATVPPAAAPPAEPALPDPPSSADTIRQAPDASVEDAAEPVVPAAQPPHAATAAIEPARPVLPVMALPAQAPIRVVLRTARVSMEAIARGAALASTLRAAGFVVDPLGAPPPQGAKPGARYFFAEDHDAAEAALHAAALPGTSILADAPNALPRPGIVELIVPSLADQAAGVAKAALNLHDLQSKGTNHATSGRNHPILRSPARDADDGLGTGDRAPPIGGDTAG